MIHEINELYKELVNSSDFDMLELELSKPNIFSILKISKSELKHSNFLAWLLHPTESHRLGSAFLKRFLREASSHNLSNSIDPIGISNLNLNSILLHREWRNIDLLIEFDDLVVCIENKLLSNDHSDQLYRYKKIVDKEFPHHMKLFVYLSPNGAEPTQLSNTYVPVSYEFIANTLQDIVDIYSDETGQKVINLINDYISTLKTDVMNNDNKSELAKKIYANHKQILDFIYEHKPDALDDVKDFFISVIQDKGWIPASSNKYYTRFTTPKLQELTYINKAPNGWTNRESFLFEFAHDNSRNAVTFKFVISPSDPSYNNEDVSKLVAFLGAPYTEASGKKWLVNYLKRYKFDYDGFYEKDNNEIKAEIFNLIQNIEKIVVEIEQLFIKNRGLLLDLKTKAEAGNG